MTLGSNFEETEAPLIEAGVTVFQNLFTVAGFLSLVAIVPALLMKVEDAEEAEGFRLRPVPPTPNSASRTSAASCLRRSLALIWGEEVHACGVGVKVLATPVELSVTVSVEPDVTTTAQTLA